MEIDGRRRGITAGDRAGAFYAGQTLRQLLPADDAFRRPSRPGPSGLFRAAGWRTRRGSPGAASTSTWPGNFLPKREVLRMIDVMARTS